MQLERIKSELKRRFYDQNNSSGKTVNTWKRIFDLSGRKYAFKTRKRIQDIALRTAGSIMKKSRGSLRNLPRERVSSNPNRWSANGRLVFIGNDTVKKPDSFFPRSGRWPPWPAPKPRRRAPTPPFPTTIHPSTDTNRKRRSTRTYLRGLGRLRRTEDESRLD
jgi:hypothetical protein